MVQVVTAGIRIVNIIYKVLFVVFLIGVIIALILIIVGSIKIFKNEMTEARNLLIAGVILAPLSGGLSYYFYKQNAIKSALQSGKNIGSIVSKVANPLLSKIEGKCEKGEKIEEKSKKEKGKKIEKKYEGEGEEIEENNFNSKKIMNICPCNDNFNNEHEDNCPCKDIEKKEDICPCKEGDGEFQDENINENIYLTNIGEMNPYEETNVLEKNIEDRFKEEKKVEKLLLNEQEKKKKKEKKNKEKKEKKVTFNI